MSFKSWCDLATLKILAPEYFAGWAKERTGRLKSRYCLKSSAGVGGWRPENEVEMFGACWTSARMTADLKAASFRDSFRLRLRDFVNAFGAFWYPVRYKSGTNSELDKSSRCLSRRQRLENEEETFGTC